MCYITVPSFVCLNAQLHAQSDEVEDILQALWDANKNSGAARGEGGFRGSKPPSFGTQKNNIILFI